MRHVFSVMKLPILLFPVLAASQTILEFGTGLLPDCAHNCPTLFTAQQLCVPSGGAPVSNQQTYDICFCHSALLTGLTTNANLYCNTVCSPSDLVQIQAWFNTLCAAAVAGTEPTPTVVASQAPTATGSGALTSSSATSSSGTSGPPTW